MKVDYPPTPSGTPEQQLQQLYRYLFRLADYLNLAPELNAKEEEGRAGNK